MVARIKMIKSEYKKLEKLFYISGTYFNITFKRNTCLIPHNSNNNRLKNLLVKDNESIRIQTTGYMDTKYEMFALVHCQQGYCLIILKDIKSMKEISIVNGKEIDETVYP